RYAASTSGNPSFSVLRQLQYLCELTQARSQKQMIMLVMSFTPESFTILIENPWLIMRTKKQRTLIK
ncbi:hypothetical protein, partial [Klebsiella pneumoniae]